MTLVKEAWIRMQGWYKETVEPPPPTPPARVTIYRMMMDRVELYHHITPPVWYIPV